MPYYPPPPRTGQPLSTLPLTPRTGRWYPFPNSGGNQNVSVGTANALATLINAPHAVPPVSVGCRVATAAAGVTVRGALYLADPDSQEPNATTFLADLGSIDASSVGAKPFPNTPPTLNGAYVVAVEAVGGTATLGGASSTPMVAHLAAPASAATFAMGWSMSVTLGAGGTWPGAFTIGATITAAVRIDVAF